MSKRFTKFLRTIVFLTLLILFLLGGFLLGMRYVNSQNERFSLYDSQIDKLSKDKQKERVIDQNTPGAVMIYIEVGDNTDKIAKKLQEKNVISHPVLFKVLSKLNGFDGGYQAGTHFVTKNMPYDEMMFSLTQKPISSKILFREGLSNKEVKKVMNDKGLVFNEELFDDILANPEKYNLDYQFLKGITKNETRKDILQGYLFPDTYTFDLNAGEIHVVRAMLNNFKNKILKEQIERAKTLNMTLDQVITLASIIEKEAGNRSEMYKISRVFHNRLAKEMPLQSCATVNFIRQENNLPPVFIVSENDLKRENPYNTYLNHGLPPGPICNPGIEAIRAALYPDTQEKGLLYFSADGKGNNVFANDFNGHLNNVQKYLVPIAKQQGFLGNVETNKDTIFSQGGDITAKVKSN